VQRESGALDGELEAFGGIGPASGPWLAEVRRGGDGDEFVGHGGGGGRGEEGRDFQVFDVFGQGGEDIGRQRAAGGGLLVEDSPRQQRRSRGRPRLRGTAQSD